MRGCGGRGGGGGGGFREVGMDVGVHDGMEGVDAVLGSGSVLVFRSLSDSVSDI